MRAKTTGLIIAAGLAVLAAGGWVWASWTAAEHWPADGRALIESDFSLIDHTGKPVTDEDFAGKWQLVFFGFTHCPDVCPTTLATVAQVLEALGGDAGKVAPLFITVDPERDTPAGMAEYIGQFDRRIVGLTGSPEQLEVAARAFRVYYNKVEQEGVPGGSGMDHSTFLYLMDPEGAYAAHFVHQDEPAKIAEDIRKYLNGEETVS
jgi:cytochrome oxidase Cu insertion factor (SCO1/SenC/PrrC family)